MKILDLSSIYKSAIGVHRNAAVPFFGLRMSSPLKADNVSFSFKAASKPASPNVSIMEVRQALDEDDNLKALRLMGFDAQEDKHGMITINGDVDFGAALGLKLNRRHSLLDEGIDTAGLMKNVRRINGNLSLDGTVTLDKNLEVSGIVSLPLGGYRSFSNFISTDDIISRIGSAPNPKENNRQTAYITPAVIKTFSAEGVLPPSVKLKSGMYYFNPDKPECRDFIKNIKNELPNLYTFSSLSELYGLKGKEIKQGIINGDLEIYGLNPDVSDKDFRALNYLYKINNPMKKRPEWRLQYDRMPRTFRIEKIDCPEVYGDGKNVPASALEALGYGSKADIAANVPLIQNDYYVKKYILENDAYDINIREVRLALENARKNNPALIEALPDAALYAVKQNGLKFVFDAYSPHEDCRFDISSPENLKALRAVDDADFQKWLDAKLDAYKKYKAGNIEKMQEFEQTELDDAQIQQDFKTRLSEMDMRRKRETGKNSLRMKAAWAVCPNTRKIMQQNFTPHIKELLNKNKAAVKINKLLMSGEMTYQEAEQALQKLDFSKKEQQELLAYYKRCWDAAGSEEWQKGLKIGRETADAYVEYGLDGIQDDYMHSVVQKWETEFFTFRHR